MWTNCGGDIARFSIMAGTNLPRPQRYPDNDPYGLGLASTSQDPEAQIAANLEQLETGPGKRLAKKENHNRVLLDISNQPAPSGSSTVPLQTRLAKKRGTGGRLSAAVFETGENLDPGATSGEISEECDLIPWGYSQSQDEFPELVLLADAASGRPSLSIFDTGEQLIPCATDTGTRACNSSGGTATSCFAGLLLLADAATGEQLVSCTTDAAITSGIPSALCPTCKQRLMHFAVDVPDLHLLADAASRFGEDPRATLNFLLH
ncbi:hypothetical protein DFH06DRAFT_690737 [Mycena polygramma]|nr:hypothetical protein DFH06DRAFT_690737 [Mycena polygramma]